MDTVEFVHDVRVELRPEDVWRNLGPAGARAPGLVEDVERAAEEAPRLASARVGVRSVRLVEKRGGDVAFEGGVETSGRYLDSLFQGAEGGLFLLATAGPGPEARVRELFAEGRDIEAFVMDAAASAIAREAYGQAIDEATEHVEGAGLARGPCLSPGGEGWPLEGQRAVFRVLPGAEVGVRLLDSLLMSPQKSQSAVIPFGAELSVLDDPTTARCQRCSARRCSLRSADYAGVPRGWAG